MSDGSLNVSVGARLWYLGSAWTVVELDGALVTMRSGDHLKKVHGSSLAGSATSLDNDSDAGDSGDLDAVALSALTPRKRSEVERQAQVFNELLMAPSTLSANERYQAAAGELGISLRTAYRRGQRYAEKGIAGLVDSRQLRSSRPTVDPGWDAICIEVLKEYRDQSNPTMKTVLKKTNALFAARFPGKVGPSRSVAYRRIRDLDKGRYTFGAAKQRRSVAERPQGHMGRLRADRPRQYVVLDTTRLDVFAMEPVTGR